MIEIYVGSNVCYTSNIDITALANIMMDDFISPDTFLPINLSDGDIAYVRKRAIQSFNTMAKTV